MAVTYRHVTARPDMLTGDILPKVDGTGAAAVPRFENIAALTSMVRDVAYWARPYADPNTYVAGYDRGDLTLSTTALRQIHEACRTGFAMTGGIADQGHGVIREDWSPRTAFPIICRDAVEGGAWQGFAAAEDWDVARCCDERAIAPVLSGDDVRRPYYDLRRMRRFFLRNLPHDTPGEGQGDWDRIVEEIRDSGGSYQTIGPFMSADGGTCTEAISSDGESETKELAGYHAPLFERTYGGGSRVRQISGAYAFGVLNYYDAPSWRSATRYLADNLDLYVHVGINYAAGDVFKGGTMLYRLRSGAKQRIANSAHKLYGRVMAVYGISDFALPQMHSLVDAWLSAHEANWSGEKRLLALLNPTIIVDSGTVKNYFQQIPDTWTWTP